MAGFGHCFSVPADPPPIPQMQASPLVIHSVPMDKWEANYLENAEPGTFQSQTR